MALYRKIAVIEDPERLVLSGLPFSPGARVEINIQEDYIPRSAAGREWGELFMLMDKSEAFRQVAPEEIAAEIAAYRAGR